MESEKPHRSGLRRRSNNFLLCFSSRSSSSRLKLSSRSMLSPGRGREGSTVSLSSSLSRRLRSNGSMKGGQGQSSPMFPTGSKKKGSSFDTQEPSSPKVTCIGQVRVKTKKKNGRKMRTRSKRREVSFRKGEDGGEGLKDRNQRWVHLPLTICEALRGFGAEFNCFSPCGGRRSACSWSSSEREKSDKNRRRRRSTNSSLGSCGVVFARWLFAIDGEEKKEMHLEKEEEEEERREKRDGVREMKEIEVEISEEDWREEMKVEAHKHDDEDEDEDEEARVSICIPPKNALLLMRCRSEPFRTSSLANRFWDSPAPKEENIDDEDEEEKEADRYKQRIFVEEEQVKVTVVQEEEEEGKKVNFEQTEAKMWVLAEESENPEKESLIEENSQELVEEKQETELAEEAEQQEEAQFEEEEIKVNDVSSDLKVEEGVEDEKRLSSSSFSTTVSIQAEAVAEAEAEAEAEQVLGEETEEPNKSTEQEVVEEEDRSVSDEVKQMEGQEPVAGPEKLHSILPDCLLLMMCEPKLSMEVSKETWVCSTDFIRARHIPEAKADGEDEKKRLSTDGSKPAQRTHPAQSNKKPPLRPQKKSPQKVQPPRSSCSEVMGRASSPGPSMMASMIEKKLVNAVAYEPLVLTRCKSEPMRASAKLAPEACFWKNRKLEPHHAPTPGLGVGAAGVGF